MPDGEGCALATVYFPNQVYRAGFCPCEALARGTLFPELVSEYPTCAAREA
ncbi:MAG: spore coat associated protein CotJA [Clostridia bacterium]|nr:spore coat associated protein CotJA [Clostridia bacterium]